MSGGLPQGSPFLLKIPPAVPAGGIVVLGAASANLLYPYPESFAPWY